MTQLCETWGNNTDRADTMTVLSSPFIWIHCICYMSVFCAKTSAVDWGQLFLMEDHQHSQYVGSAFTSSVESGGFFGGILAGTFQVHGAQADDSYSQDTSLTPQSDIAKSSWSGTRLPGRGTPACQSRCCS